jgi:hypothetical protein
MKSIFLKTLHVFLLTIITLSMSGMPFIASAAPTDNVTGYAFSDMPNSADEDIPLPIPDSSDNHYGGHGLGFIKMSDVRYGVNLGADGKFTGYAWSELGGYVQFNTSGKPEGGAQVTAGCLAGNTSCPVTGWIRFVSASNDPQSGGWDGWVKMSDSTLWSNGVVLGAPDAAKNRQMSGYAWGGDVVGWVDFSNVKVMGDWCPNIPGNQDSKPTGMIIDADGNCVTPPTCVPPLVENPDYPPEEPACVCPNTLVAPVNGSCDVPPTCPVPNPNPNYQGMTGYNALCPCRGSVGQCFPSCPTPTPNPNYPTMTTGTYNPQCPCKGTAAQCAPVKGCMTPGYPNYNVSANEPGVCLCPSNAPLFDPSIPGCVPVCTNPDGCIANPKNPTPVYIET